jgi:hypothetical protein
MKLSIEGATGRVHSANALPPWAGTPLGDCVLEVAKTARFPRFSKERVGVVYPVTFARDEGPAPSKDAAEPSGDVVTDALPEIRRRARACGLVHDIESGTRLTLIVRVSAAGRAKTVRVLPEDAVDAGARRCLVSMIKKVEFRSAPSGSSARLSITL